jgi:ABC-2 type transport system permease protein
MTAVPATPASPADRAGATASATLTERRVPPLGGLNATMVRIELRRMLRNRRTIVFALVFPAAMFFVFGSGGDSQQTVGVGNVSAYVMVSMAMYGGALIAASAGAGVAVERALGWSRQLRLTPLHPTAYILVKAFVALVMGAVAILAVNVIGAAQGKPQMPFDVWIKCGVLTLACVMTFAALGLFVGYLVPGENVMQVLGPGLALLAFLGGLFIPLSSYSPVVRDIAYWTPMFGVAEVARAPLTQELPWYAVVNAVVWLLVFVLGAAWRMSKDTARV